MQSSPRPVTAPRESSHKWITYLIEGTILVLAVVLGLVIRFTYLESAVVISRSMQPTLEVGHRLLVDHRSSLRGKWQRGDIILFEPPEDWGGGDTLTKRLIGLPGETVQIYPDAVLIDGRVMVEPYIIQTKANPVQTVTLGPGQYFVMGDNRDNSEDSRDLGPVDEENIRGRAIYRLFPPGRIVKPDYSF